VGILALLLWRLGTSAFLDGLRVIDGGTLLIAFGIGALTTVFSAWRWCLVARGLGIRLPLGAAVADYYRALFLNAALPGGVLGDVHRAVRHGRDVGDVGRGVRAVVLERSAGQVVLVTIGVTVLLTYPSPVRARAGLAPAVAVLLIGLAAALVLGLRSRHRAGRGTSWLARGVRTAGSDVRLLLPRRTWPGVLLASAVVLAGHVATFLVAARAVGSTAPLARLLPLALLALLAMTLPLNVGGWGPREGVTAWAFGAAGLSATQGLTVAVVYGLLAFVAALPGVAVLVGRWLQRLRGDAPAQPTPAQPTPAQPTPAQPAQVRPVQVRTTQARPAQVRTTPARPAQARPAQVRPARVRTIQVRPARARNAPAPVRPVPVPVSA
jgi:uncharacterized membrane protein YbhN (UPF0104 family)